MHKTRPRKAFKSKNLETLNNKYIEELKVHRLGKTEQDKERRKNIAGQGTRKSKSGAERKPISSRN